MSLSITGLHGTIIGDLNSISVHGIQGCGVYVLLLTLKINASYLSSEILLSQLCCSLELGNKKIASGFIDGRPIIIWTEFSSEERIGFKFYLSASQLNAIEAVRSNGDLKIGVSLAGSFNCGEENQGFSDRGEFLIPKQEWLGALSAMLYKDSLLFELPMPKKSNEQDKNLKELLERAHSHILNGHYQESIGLCRQAIEFIEKDRNDKKKVTEATAKYKENRREMSALERMFCLREMLKNITQLGAHHGEEFSRQQAQSVLGMTVALLSFPEIGIQR